MRTELIALVIRNLKVLIPIRSITLDAKLFQSLIDGIDKKILSTSPDSQIFCILAIIFPKPASIKNPPTIVKLR